MDRDFQEHPHASERSRSALIALKALLPLDLYRAHKRELLSLCRWKLTEAEGVSKFKTRYCTPSSQSADKRQLQHEHVYRRSKMIDALLAEPDRVDEIVSLAVGCTVTREEHAQLRNIERAFPELDGWERYRRAGLVIIDRSTGKEMTQ